MDIIQYNCNFPKQFHQRIKSVFESEIQEVKHTNSQTCRKVIAVILYEWCKNNNFLSGLKEAFSIVDESKEKIITIVYARLTNNLEDILYDKKEHNTYLDNSYLLFEISKRTHEKELLKKMKSIIRKNHWNIKSTFLTEIKEESVTIEESYNELKKIADLLMNEANRHPLYAYLLKDTQKNYLEIQELLKRTSYYDDTEKTTIISVKPPILEIIRLILEWYMQCSRKYLLYTFLEIAGKFAKNASLNNSEHKINVDTVITELKMQDNTVDSDFIQCIYNDMKTGKLKWISNNKFKIRQYRLIFFGIGMALEYNRTNPNSYKIIIEKFFNLFFKDLKIPNHTDWRFDDVICFTTSMLYRLDDRIAFSLIEVLCSITEDFSVSNRPKQEAAIYILTYLLCENKGLPNKIQHDEWNYISNSSSFYSEFAEKMFMDACELIDGKYAKKQPNFIFLYGYFTKNIKLENIDTPKNADIFLKYCAYIQAQSWYQGNMRRDAIIIDKIKILFDYVHNYLKKTSEDNILKFVYGSNLLCYALSNIIRNQGKCFIEKKKILEIIILTDFYNRYYNATYNFAKYLEQPSSMFLLCGPIRVVCCIQLDDLNYELDNEKLKMYRIWYNNENGRYKMLLTRLLSYTNFFSQLNIKIEDILTKGELFTDFLAYDNMPSTEDERNKFLEKPRTLFIK